MGSQFMDGFMEGVECFSFAMGFLVPIAATIIALCVTIFLIGLIMEIFIQIKRMCEKKKKG